MSNLLDEIAKALRSMPADVQAEALRMAEQGAKGPWVPNVTRIAGFNLDGLPVFTGPQLMALESPAQELLFGGEAGGGKTDLLLGAALTQHRQSLILRRHNAEVDGLIDRMVEIVGHDKGLKRNSPALWRFPERIVRFGGCQHINDRAKYQGVPKDFIGFDELANFHEAQYTFIILWLRSVVPGQRVRVIAATNPPTTPEGQWINKRWAPWLDPNYPNPAVPGELRYYTTVEDQDVEVDGPGPVYIEGKPLLDKRGNFILPVSRTFIPSELSDNPDLADSTYSASLHNAPAALRSAMAEGDFAKGIVDNEWQVIPSSWVEAAQSRWHPDGAKQPMNVLSADIAQGGADKTVLTLRHGGWFDTQRAYPGKETPDGPTVGGLIFMHMRDGCEVIIDMGGGYGGATNTHLKQNGVTPTLFNGAEAGMGRDRSGTYKFANKRAQAWWYGRDALDPDYGSGLALPPDPELKADLCAPTWRLTPQGVQIEPKEDTKKRIGRSPDKGDSWILANFARGKTNQLPHGISGLQSQAIVSSRRPPRR
jgi:hypothetical protein